MNIRLLNEKDDLSAFKALRIEAVIDSPTAFRESKHEVEHKSGADFREYFAGQPNGNFIVGAHDGRQLVGSAGFYREQLTKLWHKGNIWGVYVTSRYRSKGIGRLLLNRLLAQAKTMDGLEQIGLKVVTTSTPAVHLYESLGFVIYGTEPKSVYINGVYYDEHYMQLRF